MVGQPGCGVNSPATVGKATISGTAQLQLIRQNLLGSESARSAPGLAALQAAGLWGLLTQGIGLRPQPWAGISRPLGPQRPMPAKPDEGKFVRPAGMPALPGALRQRVNPALTASGGAFPSEVGRWTRRRPPWLPVDGAFWPVEARVAPAGGLFSSTGRSFRPARGLLRGTDARLAPAGLSFRPARGLFGSAGLLFRSVEVSPGGTGGLSRSAGLLFRSVGLPSRSAEVSPGGTNEPSRFAGLPFRSERQLQGPITGSPARGVSPGDQEPF